MPGQVHPTGSFHATKTARHAQHRQIHASHVGWDVRKSKVGPATLQGVNGVSTRSEQN